ncbi:MAG: hypothetical protein ACREHD_31665 [Pirellulales bacterium]
MNQGDCFFNQPSARVPSHPWIILSYPDDYPENVLIVNLTDAAHHHDHSCLLGPEDHPGVIVKASCVNYRDAKITSVGLLSEAFAKGLLYAKAPIPDAALDKIIDGAIETDELTNAHRALLRRQQMVP